MKFSAAAAALAATLPSVLACEGNCYGPTNRIEHVRHVKRMQPDAASGAAYGPKRSLEWGQLNVMHTTDTHGWLEGHLKEANYGADWGDYESYIKQMKKKAGDYGVDLLLVDTGDLHDGAGLSDATSPNGLLSNPIFDRVDYDLLTIGNHELYLADISYLTYNQFAKYWGDKYLTSNVQIVNPSTGAYEYIGKTYRYFTTAQGLRVMAFGVLFDFTGNAKNVSKIIPAAQMVQQDWFKQAVNFPEPIDVFMVLGHNPIKGSGSTFPVVFNAIRAAHPKTPIQFFGGHTHIRDFAVYDQSSTGIEAGRYCETLGWFSMSGFSKCNSGYKGSKTLPYGVPSPSKKAVASSNSTSPFVYSRRYLDWNRATFEFHATGSQNAAALDTSEGLATTSDITALRKQLGIEQLFGCAPQDWCMSCAPFGDSKNIFTILTEALSTTVVNQTRQANARYIITNTGSVRFDMYKGPFTQDDSFIVSPFTDIFRYIPDVPYSLASTVLAKLNNAGSTKRDNFGYMPVERDICVDPIVGLTSGPKARGYSGVTRRQVVDLVPGYTTKDDFGTDGDDTEHSSIPYYPQPAYFQAQAGFPSSGNPDKVDLVFIDYIEPTVIQILGAPYSESDVAYYINSTYSTQNYLPDFVKSSPKFQANVPNCPTN